MKKAALSTLIILAVTTFNLFAQQKKIEFLEYSNLTYINNKLLVKYTINQKAENNTILITKEYQLPDSLMTVFLGMINSSNVLNIASNNTVVIDGIPFSLKYKLVNDSTANIYGHPNGMTDQERLILNNFSDLISPYTNYHYTLFRESLPDGEYYNNKGMATNTLERKVNGTWKEVADPLFILNGEIISLKKFNELKLEAHKYTIETLKSPASTALYGTQAIHGAVIITNK